MIVAWVLLLLAMALPVQAVDRYVSPNGPSSGDCTQSNPCNWIYAVNTRAGGSDTVLFNNGTYLTPTHGYETSRAGTSETSRLTLQAINPRQATIQYAGPSGEGGLTHGMYIQHDNYVLRGLVIECRSSGGSYASDCFQVRGRNMNDENPIRVYNILFDNIFAKNAGHGMFHCNWVTNSEIKFSTIDQSGLTNSRGEALYLSSSNSNKPCINFRAHNNVFSRFSENGIDFKDQSRNGVAEYNIFADQRTRTTTDEEPAGTCGTGVFVSNNGPTPGTLAEGNKVRYNMLFRGITPNVFRVPDPHRFDGHDNVIWGMDPCAGNNPVLADLDGASWGQFYNNIHCAHAGADNSESMQMGNPTVPSGKPANLINRPRSECSSRITSLIGTPSILNCEIGQVAGNKTITANLQANTHGPVSTVGTASQWTVTYAGSAQTASSVAITSANKMQIVMPTQPSSSSVEVKISAAAGAIKNSAFIGRYGDCSLSVDVFKTDYGATDSQHKFPNATPGIGGGVCGANVSVPAITCTNTVGGPPPPAEALEQAVWRFYGKDNAEGQVPLGPELTNVTLGLGSAFRWRVGVRGGGSNAVERAYELAARACTPSCGAWAQVTSNFSVTGITYRYDTVQEHLAPTTNQLSLGGKTFLEGVFVENSSALPSVAIATTQQVEWEFSLVLPLENNPLVAGNTVELRMQHADGTALSTYNLPSVTIAAGLVGSRTGTLAGTMQ